MGVRRQPDSGYGFIYILKNNSMIGIYKIGLTTNSVKRRIQELNTTGVPKPFIAEKIFQVPVKHLAAVEKRAHGKLKMKGVHHGKEFFESELCVCVEAVQDAIYEVTGETSTDKVGQARQRIEAEQDKTRKLAAEQEQLKQANERIDIQRSQYADELKKRDKEKQPFFDKYFWEPLGTLILLAIALLGVGMMADGKGVGWILLPIGVYWVWKHDKDDKWNNDRRRQEAASNFPYKTSHVQQSDKGEQKLPPLVVAQGDAKARNTLGEIYANGDRGITQENYLYALTVGQRFLEDHTDEQRFLAQGDKYAQNGLGAMYYSGRGVTQNYQEAVKWFRLAAEQGLAKAQFNLGVMYELGQGVTQNYQEAVKWFHLAAQQGNAMAQNSLGTINYPILPPSKAESGSYQESLEWFQLAAEQGEPRAQNNLGWMYFVGAGVTQDYQEALKLFHLAAAQGEADAQRNLSLMYGSGEGVTKNIQEEEKWSRLASQGEREGKCRRSAEAIRNSFSMS
ncbi:MAG: GIY-YIG nuclease family protein [Candidatus Nitrotoga sp.]|nr:GIY-YIG nuclease family protein [Candidatus Nitrotoga sp.]